VLEAALDLFAEHGVSGTSLQMIADRMGVTKAAVYFQFHAKDEIVEAVLRPAMDELAEILEQADAASSAQARLDVVVTGLVDLAVRHRRLVAMMRGDPSVNQVRDLNPLLGDLTERIGRILLGLDPDAYRRVAVSTFGAGLSLATADPALGDLDDDTLRVELLHCARALFTARPKRPGTAGRR
jgi:AcrR family transcriptional regulator